MKKAVVRRTLIGYQAYYQIVDEATEEAFRLATAFLQYKRGKLHRSPNTIANNAYQLAAYENYLVEKCNGVSKETVTKLNLLDQQAHFVGFLNYSVQNGNNNNTANSKLKTVLAFYNWLVLKYGYEPLVVVKKQDFYYKGRLGIRSRRAGNFFSGLLHSVPSNGKTCSHQD